MKKNATAKALTVSVLSLVLCLSMLVGTTFAWFTDSATSSTNNILTGTLNVELEYSTDPSDETSWAAVQEDTKLFSALEADGETENFWEPGHTEVVYLRIRNAGTLALKYHFEVNVISETTFENVLGEQDCRLSDYLVFGQVVSDTATTYRTRDDAQLAAGTTLGLGNYTKETAKLLPGTAEYVTLVVYMPETIGNVANCKTGTQSPSIDFGITLVAAQTPYENDSLGDQYDKDALYPGTTAATLEELKKAITDAKAGDVIVLTENITLDEPLTIDKDITIEGNGKAITGSGTHRGFEIQSGVTAVVKNVTITGIGSGGSYSGVFHNYGTLIVENCILKGNKSEYSSSILETVPHSVQVFRNCLILNNESGRPGSGEGSVFQNYLSPSQTTFEGCIIAGNKSNAGGTSGGAICFREGGGDVTLIGCILADNDNSDFSAFFPEIGISDTNVQIKNCVFGKVYNDQADILENAANNGSTKIEGLSIFNEDGTLKEIAGSTGVIPNVYCFAWSDDSTACTLKIMKLSPTDIIIEDHVCTVTSEGGTVTAEATVGGITYTDTREIVTPAS